MQDNKKARQNILPVVLSIAGSDPSGGAGIQADLKTFTALGVYGMSVITAITSQNTQKINSIHPLPPEIVKDQFETVISDIMPDSIKIGMLLNTENISIVTDILKINKFKNIILDPVMTSKSGNCLLENKAVICLKEKLIPLVYLITPNIFEAEALTGVKIKDYKSILKSAGILKKMGAMNVLIKGGHSKDVICRDVLSTGKKYIVFSRRRIETRNTHGTGCTYSSAIASFLAKGENLETAVQNARDFLQVSIKNSVPLGKGHGPVNHLALSQRDKEISMAREEMKNAVIKLNGFNAARLIPEVQSNLAYALKNADSLNEVLGFPGRIIRLKEDMKYLSEPELGASKHIGRVVLAAMKYNPGYRAAMNIKFSNGIIGACKKLNYKISEFDRNKEPSSLKYIEGHTLEWGTDAAIKNFISRRPFIIPDIIFDRGANGKEPMVRVLGRDPGDVAIKISKIAVKYAAGL